MKSRKVAIAGLTALGLTSLTPMQQSAALMAAGAAALWASPALAVNNIPGVGIVVKKQPGDAAIVAPSDANGEVRFTGLEPGTYTVQVIGSSQQANMKVGEDGQLAFVAYEDAKGAAPPPPNPRAGGRRNPPPLPVVKRWAEQIAQPGPCNEPITCNYPRSAIDLNTASVEQIVSATGASMQSAVHIVVQHEKGGRYTSIEDFANRNCRTNAIEMNQGAVTIAEATLILAPSTGKPIVPGFQCAPGSGEQFSLYGRKHNYVGHVTLLR